MPFGGTRHLLVLLPVVAGALYVWFRRRHRSPSSSAQIAESAAESAAVTATMSEKEFRRARAEEVGESPGGFPLETSEDSPPQLSEASSLLSKNRNADDAEEGDYFGDDSDGAYNEVDDADSETFVDFAKQRVIDWAEEQVFLDGVHEDLCDLLGGDGKAAGLAALTRCSTLASYSELEDVSWPVGEASVPASWRESAYSSLNATPKTEKGRSPRVWRPSNRRCNSGCADSVVSGTGPTRHRDESVSKEMDSDNWRRHMDRYRVEHEVGTVSRDAVGLDSPVGSFDSGCGGNGDRSNDAYDGNDEALLYEFEFPSELCGRLIGRGGRNLQQLMELSRTKATLRKQLFEEGKQIVSVIGAHRNVQRFLHLVRERFPKHRNPEVNLRPVAVPLPSDGVAPTILAIHLEEGVRNRVLVSAIVSPTHLFLQLPTNDSFADLLRLDACMLACYTQLDAPMLPFPLEMGVLCAAPHETGWYRAQLIELVPGPTIFPTSPRHVATVRFVDYGGYTSLPFYSLRQIRSDFLATPFQAIECFLFGVEPVATTSNGDVGDDLRAALCMDQLVRGKEVRAEVVAYDTGGTPLVNVFIDPPVQQHASVGDENVTKRSVNLALVDKGVCRVIGEEEPDLTAASGLGPGRVLGEDGAQRPWTGEIVGVDAVDVGAEVGMVMNSLLSSIELRLCES